MVEGIREERGEAHGGCHLYAKRGKGWLGLELGFGREGYPGWSGGAGGALRQGES